VHPGELEPDWNQEGLRFAAARRHGALRHDIDVVSALNFVWDARLLLIVGASGKITGAGRCPGH
jgi:hypothetical protein